MRRSVYFSNENPFNPFCEYLPLYSFLRVFTFENVIIRVSGHFSLEAFWKARVARVASVHFSSEAVRKSNLVATIQPFDGMHTFAQVKNASALEAFERHYGYFIDDELRGLDSLARAEKVVSIYSTALYAPINEQRFGPGTLAQKLGGFEWQWWLIVEADLVREYRTYLERFDAHGAAAEAARQAVDAARERWFEKEIESKFKSSLAYSRNVE
jgi:hypothetical protein